MSMTREGVSENIYAGKLWADFAFSFHGVLNRDLRQYSCDTPYSAIGTRLIDLLMGLFRGAVFRHGGGARKQPIKQPIEMPTSTMALMGRFPSLMGRCPTLMGRFPISS